jgi:hypothetical protein
MRTMTVFFKTPGDSRLCRTAVRAVAAIFLLAQFFFLSGCSSGPTDEELQNKVVTALGNDTRLQVTAKDGDVTITGIVPDNATRQQVNKTAAATQGVKNINDHIQVPPPRVYTLPAGTMVCVVMLDSVDSSVNRVGQTFTGTLAFPLTSGDEVVVAEGTEVLVMLTQARQAGSQQGSSQLELALKSITYRGTTYELYSSMVTAEGESRGRHSAHRSGVVGTIIGKVKGVLIKVGIGTSDSSGHHLSTRGPSVRVPAQTELDFTLQDAVTFTLAPQ